MKGLSNVRNKYEKGSIQELNYEDVGGPSEPIEEEFVSPSSVDKAVLDPLEIPRKAAHTPKPPRKRKRHTEVIRFLV